MMLMTLLLALAGSAQADVPARVVEAMQSWTECAILQTRSQTAGPAAPDAVADAALVACHDQAAALRGEAARDRGDAFAENFMSAFTASTRTQLINIVLEARGLVTRPRTEENVYGDCVEARARALLSGPEPAEAIVELAWQQCAEQERALRTRLTRERGAAMADQIMAAGRTSASRVLVQLIRQERAGRAGQ
jgi:hypothetical protein